MRLRTIRFVSATTMMLVAAATVTPAATPRPATGSVQAPRATLAIVGGMLIDGRGSEPVHRSVILLDGPKIVAVGTTADLPVPAGARIIDASGQTVMGGLTDAHVHLDFLGHADYVKFHKDYSALGAVGERISVIAAKQLLMAGVTTAVDLGGAPETQIRVRDRINRRELVGPRMKVSAGWLWNATDEQSAAHHRGMEGYLFNVRTVDEARTAIAKTLALGADIVKNYSGLSAEQTRVVIEEAHKKGIKVTGHGEGNARILEKIALGQDAIEHTINPDAALLAELVARRTWVVPSLQQNVGIEAHHWPMIVDSPRFKALMPPDLYAYVRDSVLEPAKLPYFRAGVDPARMLPQLANVKRLHDAGVRLLIGTDSGTPINYHTDATRQQMELMVRAGIPPMRVLGMATRDAADYLGMSATLGTVEPGKLADLIVIDGNPLLDMKALQYVTVVVKEGVQYKGPGTDPAVIAMMERAQ